MIETFSLVTKQRTSRERNDKRRLERRPKEGEEQILVSPQNKIGIEIYAAVMQVGESKGSEFRF